jgi:hypothetical protein
MVIASIAVAIAWRLLQRMLVLMNWGSRANARDQKRIHRATGSW